ncbi:serine/threonine-protein kinase [Corallococcus exiguus]|uniref:serine/threonine-protein kinase n=1 Tax=Corallococcus exiguus TaxID=83462 RepID=UPI001472620D|nr:serine/threonine-protein kinase [Corallococcus exiguus]NNB86191.1 serine/threonine protein kinase [Corallococcus exiguus]
MKTSRPTEDTGSQAPNTGHPTGDSSVPERPLHATRVGRYVLLARLGKGGMGEVFEAFDPELRRTVAIKLLHERRLPDEEEDARALRLVREAQAMARLSHPNVLTVHDVGTHEGRVFIAMARVEGGTLRQWLREGPHPQRQVLAVCRAMGQGLAAAHTAGLVHRDFKPDNVLLGRDGGVWVTDFGIASDAGVGTDAGPAVPLAALLEGPLDTRLTATGALVGTPAYMAPEQYAGRGPDARADQFSYCVSVYEALTGQRPFEEGTLRRMAVTLLDSQRAPQGAVVPRVELEPPEHPSVPGWVHRVLAQGLAVAPEQRFASMEALLAALERDPEEGRKKLAGRSIAVVAGLLLGVGVAWVRPTPCSGAPKLFARVWGPTQKAAVAEAFEKSGAKDADGAFDRVERALDAYASEWSRMHRQACEATRVTGEQPEAHLALRMSCLDRRLRAVDALGAELAHADVALVQRSAEAVDSLRGVSGCANVEALSAAVPPPEDQAARTRVDAVRKDVAHAQALLDTGRYAQAVPVAKAAVEAAHVTHYRPVEAEALHVLGWAHHRMSQSRDARATWHEAMAAATAGRHDEVALQVATELVLGLSGDPEWFPEAHLWSAQAHALIERLGSAPDLEGRLANHEGILALNEEALDAAAEHYTRALALRERTLGPTHVDTAKVYNNLGMVMLRQGKKAEATALYQKALAIYEERLGPVHPLLAGTLTNLGFAEQESGNLPKALEWLQRAYTLQQQTLGPLNSQTLLLLHDIALVQESLGAPDRALALHRQALEGMRQGFGAESREAIDSLKALAGAEERLERDADALAHFQEGLALQRKVLPPEEFAVDTLEEDVGRLMVAQGRPKEAVPLLRAALDSKSRSLGAEHARTIHSRTALGLAYFLLGQGDSARELLETSERVLAPLGWNPVDAAMTHFALAQALWGQPAEHARALTLANKAEDGFAQGGNMTRRELAAVRQWIASR